MGPSKLILCVGSDYELLLISVVTPVEHFNEERLESRRTSLRRATTALDCI
jgi:hypothetical protein